MLKLCGVKLPPFGKMSALMYRHVKMVVPKYHIPFRICCTKTAKGSSWIVQKCFFKTSLPSVMGVIDKDSTTLRSIRKEGTTNVVTKDTQLKIKC
uniref:Ovule protein n=1 Tax=Ascaris lumbricoides TaxID=6252 RepID=A0A0M3HX61_ASCLU